MGGTSDAAETEDVKANEAWLCDVYRDYVASINRMEGMRYSHFSPTMKDKLGRLTMMCGMDMVTRSQDVCDSIFSLTCKHYEDDWYVVTFRLCDNSASHCVPVKLSTDGQKAVEYITPVWGNDAPDLQLFNIPRPKIKANSKEMLVKTFYESYAYKYSLMPQNLEAELARLRRQYCTARMQELFDSKQREVTDMDSMDGFDLMINGFDFDIHWYKSLTVERIDDETFRVGYCYKELANHWIVKVRKENGKWKIDDVHA